MRFPLILLVLLIAFSAVLYLLPSDLIYALRESTSLSALFIANLVGLNAFHEYGTVISIAGKRLDIVLDCTALNYCVIFTAALLAWPAGFRKKIWGLSIGLVLIMMLNLSRIVFLGWLGGTYPAWFEIFHSYLWEGGFLVVVLLLWISWVRMDEGSFLSIVMKCGTDLTIILLATIFIFLLSDLYLSFLAWASTATSNFFGISEGRLTGVILPKDSGLMLYLRGQKPMLLSISLFAYLPFLFLMRFSHRGRMKELKTILSLIAGGLILFLAHLTITVSTFSLLIKGNEQQYIGLLTSLSLISPVLIWMLIRAVDGIRNVNNEHMKAGSDAGLCI